MNKSRILIIILILGCSCGLQRNNSNFPLNVKKIDVLNSDSLILFIEFENISADTIIFPTSYTQFYFQFDNKKIIQTNFVHKKMAYPVILNENESIDTVENCSIYLTLIDYQEILPNQAFIKKINLTKEGYKITRKSKNYGFTFTLFVSKELQQFCPKIYSGSIKYRGKMKKKTFK